MTVRQKAKSLMRSRYAVSEARIQLTNNFCNPTWRNPQWKKFQIQLQPRADQLRRVSDWAKR